MVTFRMPAAVMVFLFASCAADGAGCYVFDWRGFTEQQMTQVWFAPEAVVLTSRRIDAEWRAADARVPSKGQRHTGEVLGWDATLYDRRWSKTGDTITIRLKDLGYHDWNLVLAPSAGAWAGEARYTTTIGGGERTFAGSIFARQCSEDS